MTTSKSKGGLRGRGGFGGAWLRRALGLGRSSGGPGRFAGDRDQPADSADRRAGAGRCRIRPPPGRSPAFDLGAATDDPVRIADRAARDARRADLAADIPGRRMAAETTWLAVTAVADVAAVKLGLPEPRSAGDRMEVFQQLERAAGVRRGSLTRDFELARRLLHVECFHADSCPADLVPMIEDYRGVVAGAMTAVAKVAKVKIGRCVR